MQPGRLASPRGARVQVFLALVAFHFQSPLVFIGCFKSGKLPFFLSRFHLYSLHFTQTKGTERKFVSERCENAYKVHIANLLLKSPCRLACTPSIKTLLPVWRFLMNPYISAVVSVADADLLFFPGKTPLRIYRRGLSDIHLAFTLYRNTPTVGPLLSDEQICV